MKKDILKIIGAFVALYALASVLIYSLTFQQAYHDLIAGLEARLQEQDALAVITYILLEALAVMLSPFSSLPFIVVATSLWGKLLTLLYTMIGSLLGASLAYFFGSQAVYRLLKRFVPAKTIDKYGQVITEKSSFLLVELFFLAMPVEIPGYVLGAAKYTYWKFILAAFIAYLPFNMLIIYAGEAFIQRNTAVLGVFLGLFVGLFCMALYAFYRKVK